MKTPAKLTEQDLTDYALNELPPNERLYVESLLAVDEESRNDIYASIDLALMLEKGFERETDFPDAGLTGAQRERVLAVEVPNLFLRRSALALAAAAGIALALMHQDAWLPKESATQVARASSKVSRYVVEAVSANALEGDDSFRAQTAMSAKADADPNLRWLPTPSVSTPFSWNPTPAVTWDSSSRGSFDVMP